MQFEVIYTDTTGAANTLQFAITPPRFIKHFVLAGAGFTPTRTLLARGIGAVAWYWDFVKPVALGADHFGEPIPILRDPTLKAHFSCLAGRAFADFLSREIEKSWATLSYEGVLMDLGLAVSGERPDPLAVNPTRVVALEAKGYAKKYVSEVDMAVHKTQAGQGALARDSWAASVAYGLYDKVRVKYPDPIDDSPRPNPEDTRVQFERYLEASDAAAIELGGAPVTIHGREFLRVPLPEIVRGRVPLDVDQSEVLNAVTLIIERGAKTAREAMERERQRERRGREATPSPPLLSTPTLFVDADGIGISMAG